MAAVNQTAYAQSGYQNAYSYEKTQKSTNETKQKASASKAGRSAGDIQSDSVVEEKKVAVDGPGTYGNPQLSQKALDYYNELKKRYGNLNFVLVSSDKKQEAELLKGSFANSRNLTVLIDTDKIEKMASDEAYRARYEGIISNAASGLSQMKAQMGSTAGKVKSYGMTFSKTGLPSYFAVIDKSLDAQRKRIEKKAEKKAADKKKEAKRAEKEAAAKQLHEGAEDEDTKMQDTVTITAGSVEELLKKIDDYYQQEAFERIRTSDEKSVGAKIDYSA